MAMDPDLPRAFFEPMRSAHFDLGDLEEASVNYPVFHELAEESPDAERQIQYLSDQLELEREKTRRVIEHYQTYRLPADQDYRLRTELAEALRWGKDQQARADQAVSDLMSAQRETTELVIALNRARRLTELQEQTHKAEFEKMSCELIAIKIQNEKLTDQLIKVKHSD